MFCPSSALGANGHRHKHIASIEHSGIFETTDPGLTDLEDVSQILGSVMRRCYRNTVGAMTMSREEDWPKKVMCTTFGAPFVGNDVLGDEVERLQWQNAFLHVVGHHDIVPRLLLCKAEGTPNVIQMPFFSDACYGMMSSCKPKGGSEPLLNCMYEFGNATVAALTGLCPGHTPTMAPHLLSFPAAASGWHLRLTDLCTVCSPRGSWTQCTGDDRCLFQPSRHADSSGQRAAVQHHPRRSKGGAGQGLEAEGATAPPEFGSAT